MARPDEREPLDALIRKLKTVQARRERAEEQIVRYKNREKELKAMVAAERKAVQADLAAAELELEE